MRQHLSFLGIGKAAGGLPGSEPHSGNPTASYARAMESTLALLHSPAHEPSDRRQMDTEVLGDFPIGVSARGVGRHYGGVSFTAILGNLRQRWGGGVGAAPVERSGCHR